MNSNTKVSNMSEREDFEAWAYEWNQRLKWWCNGIGIHCIPLEMFWGIPTERIVELYNVELSYFRKSKP